MKHVMKLTEGPFERMKNGLKTYELRLYDEKRRDISCGDIVEFARLPELKESIQMRVTSITLRPKFEDIIDLIPASFMGYSEDQRTYLRTSMYEIYTKEDEAKYGAMGLHLELVDNLNADAGNGR